MKPVLLLTLFLGTLLLGSMVVADPETLIVAQMKIEGEHTHYGDEFSIRATVTNVGSVPAENVIVHIEGVPPEWEWAITSPGDFTHILPGQSVSRVYRLTNQGGQPNVLVWAWGPNTNTAYSNHIQLPIHPVILGLSTLVMGGLYWVSRQPRPVRGTR